MKAPSTCPYVACHASSPMSCRCRVLAVSCALLARLLYRLDRVLVPSVAEATVGTAGAHLKYAYLCVRGCPASFASSASLAVLYHSMVGKFKSVSMAPRVAK